LDITSFDIAATPHTCLKKYTTCSGLLNPDKSGLRQSNSMKLEMTSDKKELAF
jgi:hypothetical protein